MPAPSLRALPSLQQLRYLLALSELRNFTRAAEACYVTQSTLSAGLKELESTLGSQLVERDRQSVRMTPLGEEVAVRARELLARASDLVESAAAARSMAGTVRLGVIPTVAPFLLPQVLPGLRKRHPGLRLALREDLTANLLARLHAGELDFALIALPFATGELLVEPIFDDELWLVAPAGDPVLGLERLVISQKVAGRLLLLEEGHCLRDQTLQACGRRQVASAGELEATSLLTLLQMVESGLGLALVPEIAIQAGILAMGSLVARPLAAPAPRRTIALLARKSTARVEEFAAIATAIGEMRAARHAAVMTSKGRRRGEG